MIYRNQSECDLLESIAVTLETRAGNEVYRRAWKAAAKLVRERKMLTDESQVLTDNLEQISSS